MAQMGGKPAPAAGFAIGAERLLALLEEVSPIQPARAVDVYVVHFAERSEALALQAAEQLRSAGLRVQQHGSSASVKSQMKKADASGALMAVLIGEAERDSQQVVLKPLRLESQQVTVSINDLAGQCLSLLSQGAAGA
jgi:histidyl-tRNA synthetase